MLQTVGSLSTEALEARDNYLRLIHPNHKSHVTNLFLGAARDGLRKPSDVLARVVRDVDRRYSEARAAGDAAQCEKWAAIWPTLGRPEALAFAAWAITYAALPDGERQRMREARRIVHIDAYMETQPATESQLALLRRLGWTGYPTVDNRAQAAALITSLMGKGGRRG